jgi:hypothetical protein
MFKFIFRVMTVTVFLCFLTIGLVLWKGGEPFRWWGDGLVIIGRTISRFGDVVDDLIKKSKRLQDNYEKIGDVTDNGR